MCVHVWCTRFQLLTYSLSYPLTGPHRDTLVTVVPSLPPQIPSDVKTFLVEGPGVSAGPTFPSVTRPRGDRRARSVPVTTVPSSTGPRVDAGTHDSTPCRVDGCLVGDGREMSPKGGRRRQKKRCQPGPVRNATLKETSSPVRSSRPEVVPGRGRGCPGDRDPVV